MNPDEPETYFVRLEVAVNEARAVRKSIDDRAPEDKLGSMRTLNWTVGSAALLLGLATTAEAARPSCAHAEITKARRAGRAAHEGAGVCCGGRDPAAAGAEVRDLFIPGSERRAAAGLDFYWIHSDLSFALYRAGRFRDCLETLSQLTYPGPPDGLSANGLDDHPVAKAIAYNEGLCEAALMKRYDKLADKPCPHRTRLIAQDRDSIAAAGRAVPRRTVSLSGGHGRGGK